MGADENRWRPPESWRKAFEEQATEEAMAGVYAYAASRARMIEKATRRCDPLIARELVLDAMSDTFAGVLTWDPDLAPLAAHLCRVIRSRTSHELERAKQFVHLSLDNDASPTAEALEEVTSNAMAAAQAVPDEVATGARARDVVTGIRRLAGNDPPLLQLLLAFEEGATERQDVMRVTGMSSTTYHNTRRRLLRLAAKLPDDVRDTDVQVMA